MRTRVLSSVVVSIFALCAASARPAFAQPCTSSSTERVYDLYTFLFLDELALERQVEPSTECQTLYVRLDKALDRLIDTSDWQHVAWQFSRSGIYATLDALQANGCEEDLSQSPSNEQEPCPHLRQQGRCQLHRIEQSKTGKKIIHGRAMDAFQAQVKLGRAIGCLTPPREQDATANAQD